MSSRDWLMVFGLLLASSALGVYFAFLMLVKFKVEWWEGGLYGGLVAAWLLGTAAFIMVVHEGCGQF